jgi:phosphatidylserine/phosphatidylglycerophosphate/cardiolipin synthase-like enzyme
VVAWVSTVPTAVSWSLIVSPYDAKDEVLWYIAWAKYSLDGWFYQITDTAIVQALDLKAQTGVASELIIERSMYGWNTKSYDTLVKKLKSNSRIQIKSDDRLWVNFNHTKTFIRDDEDILIATANLSYPSFARNREYRVVVKDTAVVDNVRQLFDDDRDWKTISRSDIHPSLLVCPINCRSWLDALLGDVLESVRMQAQYIEDDKVIERLHELKSLWIDIRLLVWEFQDEEKLDWLPYRIQENFYNHSKSLYIDWEHVLIWSMNYSTNSIEENREISVLLNNPKTLGLFRWQFEQDWEASE